MRSDRSLDVRFRVDTRGVRLPGPLGLAVEWRWSRPAMMVSLNVNQTMNAGRRLCIEYDVLETFNAWKIFT
jgi:hypothetical protein